MFGAGTDGTEYILPHVLAGIDTRGFTLAFNGTDEIAKEFAVGVRCSEVPAAPS